LSPCVSGYFTYIQNMKSVTNKFKSGRLHEQHVVATSGILAASPFSRVRTASAGDCVSQVTNVVEVRFIDMFYIRNVWRGGIYISETLNQDITVSWTRVAKWVAVLWQTIISQNRQVKNWSFHTWKNIYHKHNIFIITNTITRLKWIKSHYLKPLKTTYYLLHVSILIGSSSGRSIPY